MANQLLTIQMITNEALAVLENELTFTKFVNRQYDSSFGKSGAKIGNTLNIRKPPRYIGRTGAAISIEDAVETSVPLALSTQRGVDIQFSSTDLALSIDDFSERFIKPAIVSVANAIDLDGLTLATNSTYNTFGTTGAGLPNGSYKAVDYPLQAGVKLDQNSTPRSANLRSIVWDPASQAAMVSGLSGLFNAPTEISQQYQTGNMGKALGFKHSVDQNVLFHTVGNYGGAGAVNGAAQTGNSLVTNGWTASRTGLLNVGDVFTIAGVYAVNPVSRAATTALQQFVVTSQANSDASGNATLQISPAITTSGQFQTVSAAPANGAVITVVGAAGAVGPQSLAFHRDAFTLATADLPLPDGVDMAARKSDPQTGLSVRMIRQYNITTDQWPCRLDILYGWAALYPQWSCRIAS